MNPFDLLGQVIEFIPILKTAVWDGIIVTATLFLFLNISNRKYDPTIFKRVWRKLMDQILEPIGNASAKKSPERISKPVAYYMGAASFGVVLSMTAYLLIAEIMLGTAIASYYIAGYVPTLTPVIESIAGFTVLLGIAITIEAASLSGIWDKNERVSSSV